MSATPPELTWRERARRVREGDVALADVPTVMHTDEVRDLLAALLNRTFDSVILSDRATGEYLEVSDSFCSLTGYERADLLGQTSLALGLIDRDENRLTVEGDVAAGREGIYANVLRRKDGQTRHVEFTHQFVDDTHLIVIVRDVSERHRHLIELQRLATEDELTRLLNRRGFAARMNDLLATARDSGENVHLLLADVDGLKATNDSLGHEFGDQLLQHVAEALVRAAGPNGLVGRLGGDEFAVALIGAADTDDFRARLDADLAGRRGGPVGSTRPVSVSTGVATAQSGTTTIGRMLAAADADLYRAKRARDAGQNITVAKRAVSTKPTRS